MKHLPKISFAHLPTPVEHLPKLSAILGGPRLLVKRDDQTGLAFGGNKTRKLEFLLADAVAHGAKMLITTGAVQSNHCRQTAAAAARQGMACTLVLAGEKPDKYSSNTLLDKILGANLVWCEKSQRDEVLKETFDHAWKEGKRPYLVPYGGSSPIGAAAYAYAIEEMMQQGIQPDWIVFASSSGGTQAGLIAGTRLFGCASKILGISVDERAEVLSHRVAKLTNEILDRLGASDQITPEDVFVNDHYLGEGYGVMGEPEAEAIRLLAQNEGILVDPVYTGRAAAGLIDLIRTGFFKPDETVLFWHTGGTPALFAERYREILGSF